MTAVEASSVRLNTMADGTLRITCDIEPRHAQDAFRLFGSPGTPMALAALKPTKLEDKEPDKPKGGPLSQDAARICQTPEFQAFVQKRFGWGEASEEFAANHVRSVCGIKSRAELDHDPRAARLFSSLMTQYREAA